MILTQPFASLIAALVIVGGGAIAYWNQKRLDRKNTLSELRRNIYQEFLDVLCETTAKKQLKLADAQDAQIRFQRVQARMTAVASDDVLSALANLNSGDSVTLTSNGEPYYDLIMAIRKDVFEGSSASKIMVTAAFPINF